jgi:Flp pilus assembly protein TadG
MVETAISFSLLSMLMFGVFEVCLAVYAYHFLASTAHEATRYAIVRGSSWSSSCDGSGKGGSGYGASGCTASPTDIANFVANRNFPGLHVTADDVCVEYFSSVPSSTSTTCSGNSSPNAPGNIVQVTINYPFTLSIPFLKAQALTMSSTSQMVISQ